jgi:hypothetical protein
MKVKEISIPTPFVDVLFEDLDKRIFKTFNYFKRYNDGSWYYYNWEEFSCNKKQTKLLEKAYQEHIVRSLIG